MTVIFFKLFFTNEQKFATLYIFFVLDRTIVFKKMLRMGDLTMETTLSPFDITQYLNSEEAIAQYLTQVLEEGDTDELIRAIGHIAKARGMSQIAQESGLGRESLYKTFAPGSKPRFDTIAKVVHSLGLHFQITPALAS